MNQVYKITNKINNKVYIGITTQGINRRWSEHLYRFNSGERDHKIYLAMKKYGIENFELSVIDETDDSGKLSRLEIRYI
jgi:group I intron endonuclease